MHLIFYTAGRYRLRYVVSWTRLYRTAMQIATSQEVKYTRNCIVRHGFDDSDECFKKYHIVFCDSQKKANLYYGEWGSDPGIQ